MIFILTLFLIKIKISFCFKHPGGTIFGQNLPSSLVLSDSIKPKQEEDSFDIDDSKEDAMLPDDNGFVTIGEKEMLGYIDKFFTNHSSK